MHKQIQRPYMGPYMGSQVYSLLTIAGHVRHVCMYVCLFEHGEELITWVEQFVDMNKDDFEYILHNQNFWNITKFHFMHAFALIFFKLTKDGCTGTSTWTIFGIISFCNLKAIIQHHYTLKPVSQKDELRKES